MGDKIKRAFSVLLVCAILLMQCGVAFAANSITGDVGENGYLVIVDYQSEYTVGEEFSANLKYHSADGNAVSVPLTKCDITGFDSNVTITQKQEVTIHYEGCFVTCVVTVYADGDGSGEETGNIYENLIWYLNENTRELYVSGSGEMPDFEGQLPPWEEYMDRVKKITIGGELTSISKHAFENCSNAIVVNIEADIEVIRTDAFANCHNIRAIYMPASVMFIEEVAFRHCEYIQEIHYRGDTETWLEMERHDEYFEQGRVHYNCTEEPTYEVEISDFCVIWYQEEYRIGEELQVDMVAMTPEGSEIRIFIDECTVEGFDCRTVGEQNVIIRYGEYEANIVVWVIDDTEPNPEETVTIENVKSEYEYGEDFYAEVYIYDAEGNCTQAEDFTVEGFDSFNPGEQVVTIRYNDYSEDFCIVVNEKEEIVEEGINWSFDKETGELVISGSGDIQDYEQPWKEYAESIKMVTIKGNVTSIGSGVFVRCTNLTVVNIEAPVTTIRTNAFQGCPRIRRLYLTDSISSIEEYAFTNGYQLRRVYYRGTSDTWNSATVGDKYLQTAMVYYNFNGIPSVVEEIKQLIVNPIQTDYSIGEQLSLNIHGYIADFGQISLNIDECVVEGFDNQVPGEQLVTIRYGECSADITVTVIGDEEPEPTETVSIENVKTEYEYGEDFYAEVYVYDADGNCTQAEDFTVEGFDSCTPGEQTVKVCYGDCSETFTVTVNQQVSVEPENAPTVTVSNEKCLVGNTVDVVVSLSNNKGFSNLGLEIEYDTALTLVGVSANSAVGATFTMAQTLDVYPYNIGLDSVSNTDYNGDLVTLTFEVPEDTQPGEYFVNVDFYKGRNGDYVDGISVNYDENYVPLGLCYVNGAVSVYNYVPGDINSDGIVTNKDGTAMLRYLAGWDLDNIVEDALDTDGDGVVTNKDGTRLLRYLAGWDVEIN